jgi:adenylylsulfate kinase-like enzyme
MVNTFSKTKFYKSVPKILEIEKSFLEYLESKLLLCKDRNERVLYGKAIRNQLKKIKALEMLKQF